MKSITSVLDVETDCVDNAIGAGNGGRHGAFVMCVGGGLFDAIVLGPGIVPRDHGTLVPDARKSRTTRRPTKPVPPNTVTQLIPRSVELSFATLLIDPSSAARTVLTASAG